jgi:hypothetical protein
VPAISATMNISMDGVIQAPGRPDEDTRGGFDRGGWAMPYYDEVMAQRMGEGIAASGGCSSSSPRTNGDNGCEALAIARRRMDNSCRQTR